MTYISRMKKGVGKLFLSFVAVVAFFAPDASGAERSDSAEIYFHQSDSHFLPGFRGNGARLDSLAARLGVFGKSDAVLRSVRFSGSASPEGSVAINRRLSARRADRAIDYLRGKISVPDSLVSVVRVGRDWSGLLAMAKGDTALPYRAETITLIESIIRNVEASGRDSESNLRRIKALRDGVPYRYMYSRYFPALRVAKLTLEYDLLPQIKAPEEDSLDLRLNLPEVEIADFSWSAFIAREEKPFYMDLRTNMLYDALAVPNIGAEFYLGKNFSAGANWMYGWWDKNSAHRYWRVYGGDLNVRWWFGQAAERKPLTGHHVGIYGGVVTYDFEFGGRGYMGGLPHRTLWDRCNVMAGVEYGYSLPVAKRLNIDFTIGIGYLGGKYIKYVPKGNGYLYESTRHLTWVGPTKAEISLVWLIGRGNENRKGGAL